MASLAVGAVLVAQAAAAAPLTLLTEGRTVQAFAQCGFPDPFGGPCMPGFSLQTPSPAFAPFNAMAFFFDVNASQNTTVTTSGMGGTQSVQSGPGSGGDSIFYITFSADVPVDYTWVANGSAVSSGGAASMSAELKNLTTNTALFSSSGIFNNAGSLVAGNQYSLSFNANSGGGGSSNWTQNFQVTAVPEPSTAALVGLGLLGLARRSRRRR